MISIAVTGARGRLGRQLVEQGCLPVQSDVLDFEALRYELRCLKPDAVIQAAAVTDVDGCEKEEVFKLARRVAIRGTHNLLDAFNGKVVYLSTDYIFDGKKGPYKENAKPYPLSAYGYSKWGGEVVMGLFGRQGDNIVRTTILYGGHKPDFARKMIDNLSLSQKVSVPKNLYGSPTYVPHLAEALIKLCAEDIQNPIIHIAGRDVLSRYEFALIIANVFGFDTDLISPSIYKKLDGEADRPKKAGLRVDLADKLGLPIYEAVEGVQVLKEQTLEKTR